MREHLRDHREGREHLIALIGSPNSGKTSLYNWLTGSKFKTVNYPGATVDCYLGAVAKRFGTGLHFMDTPGTYSLIAKSPDEAVTIRALFEPFQHRAVDAVIVVIDATQMFRQLVLFEQVKQAGFRCLVVLTMLDILKKSDTTVNIQKLQDLLGVPIFPVEGRLGGGVKELVQYFQNQAFDSPTAILQPEIKDEATIQILRQKIQSICQEVVECRNTRSDVLSQTLFWDSIFLNRWLGLPFFVFVMASLFTGIFYFASPFMEAIDWLFTFLSEKLGSVAAGQPLLEFFASGVIPSFGAVLVFVPQIFILFLGIGVLEDSGYLARAATLIDRPFSKLGLSGRSFVPLLSGFACAVPAMMATRNINSSRERWIVLFILPLMTCSARLPVYALLLSFLFFGSRAWQAGIALAILYILSIVIGAVAASLVNRILKHQRRGHFVMELPVYRQPQWFLIFKTSLYKTKSYAQRAGPVIFAVALTLWLLSSFPRENGQAPPLAHSYTAQIGKKMEPIFKPMGLDWRAGVGLLSAFSAREVFVSSLALVMNLSGHAKDKQLREGLLDKMRNAVFENGQRVFTQASVAGLICFFMLASQCLSTTTMAAREWRSWRLAIFQVVFFNGLAYALSICVVQTLRAFGIP